MALLEVSGLVKHYPVTRGILFRKQIGTVKAVDGLSFSVDRGQTVALVWESGCGKSTTARAVLRLIEPLRALRMLHHASWIALRWSDPAFPRAFPWFGGMRYWEAHINDLLEQVAAIDDPPLLSG